MQITLQKILPIPLAQKLITQQSDVWNQNCCFDEKEWIKIKASSGTGKTTLIHLLYNLRNDYTGNILYNEVNVKSLTDEKIATYRQKEISIIFQDLRLFGHLTALENIQLKRSIHPSLVSDSEMNHMIDCLGIRHIVNQKANICSYGEQQRIAIIRALMQPFKLLLMDEPFSHLDKENTTKAATLIANICKKNSAGFVLTDLEADNHFTYSKLYNL
jgi:ABC-type lipoprotein export system ATPase subunit